VAAVEFYLLADDRALAGSGVARVHLDRSVSRAGGGERAFPELLPQVSVGTGRGEGGIVGMVWV